MKFKIMTALALSSCLSLANSARANNQESAEILSPENATQGESFSQGNVDYVYMPNLVGVVQKYKLGQGFESESKSHSTMGKTFSSGVKAAYSANGLEIYKRPDSNQAFDLRKMGEDSSRSRRMVYDVVLRKVVNIENNSVSYRPGLLTGNIVVKSKTFKSLNTPLELKKSFSDAGFFIYELPHNQTISNVLSDLNKNPEVESANVEIIENLKVPM